MGHCYKHGWYAELTIGDCCPLCRAYTVEELCAEIEHLKAELARLQSYLPSTTNPAVTTLVNGGGDG
jgi:hypothetical protein